jgi:DNA-binding CsgD family transcriptional regulator
MKIRQIAEKDRRMLELLSRGLSNAVIADKMGLKHGTTRVYLHALYRKIGVASKTAAVVWYADHLKGAAIREAAAALRLDESVGDLALRIDLYTALGAMNLLLGPYGKVWYVAARLKGGADPQMEAARRRTRYLWEFFVRGDFAQAKRISDRDEAAASPEASIDAMLLALLTAFGGHAGAAPRVTSLVARARRGSQGLSAKEGQLLEAACRAADAKERSGLEALHRAVSGAAQHTFTRHAGIVALYHAYRARGDTDRAKATAQALWAEAENARQQLQAMGERPFPREVTLPAPETEDAKDSALRHIPAHTAR